MPEKLGEAYVEITARHGRYDTGLRVSRGKLDRFVRHTKTQLTGLGRYIAARNPFRMLLGGMGIAFGIAGVSMALKRAIQAIAGFEQQMAMVNTMLDNRSAPLMEQYSRSLLKMSATYGESTDVLAKGLYDILSASVAAGRALDVLDVSVRAAKAGFTTTAVAADAITTIMNAYSMSASDAERISDMLFATVKRGKTTFPELASTIGRVTASAAVSGLRFEELAAALATMTRAGINSHQAVTSMNMILRAFLKPQGDAIKLAHDLGFELNSQTLANEGLLYVVERLSGAKAEHIAKIFVETRALRGMAAILQDIPGFMTDIEQTTNAAGKATEAYAKAADTLYHNWARFKEEIGAKVKSKTSAVSGMGEQALGGGRKAMSAVERTYWDIAGTSGEAGLFGMFFAPNLDIAAKLKAGERNLERIDEIIKRNRANRDAAQAQADQAAKAAREKRFQELEEGRKRNERVAAAETFLAGRSGAGLQANIAAAGYRGRGDMLNARIVMLRDERREALESIAAVQQKQQDALGDEGRLVQQRLQEEWDATVRLFQMREDNLRSEAATREQEEREREQKETRRATRRAKESRTGEIMQVARQLHGLATGIRGEDIAGRAALSRMIYAPYVSTPGGTRDIRLRQLAMPAGMGEGQIEKRALKQRNEQIRHLKDIARKVAKWTVFKN